jgi:hypothetical protein
MGFKHIGTIPGLHHRRPFRTTLCAKLAVH